MSLTSLSGTNGHLSDIVVQSYDEMNYVQMNVMKVGERACWVM